MAGHYPMCVTTPQCGPAWLEEEVGEKALSHCVLSVMLMAVPTSKVTGASGWHVQVTRKMVRVGFV